MAKGLPIRAARKDRDMTLVITSTRVLTADGAIRPAVLRIEDGHIAAVAPAATPPPAGPHRSIDAGDRLVLPGAVDLHGDAFERNIMPRPGVRFALDLALWDTDRQLLANGITTAFHGITYSWEPGLRGAETVRALVAAWRAVRGRLGCDTRLHLRFETHNLAAADEVQAWLADGTFDLLAFNDHLDDIAEEVGTPHKAAKYAERTGMAVAEFRGLLDRVRGHGSAVPATVRRLAAAARRAGVPMLSHDDPTPEARRAYAAIGCTIAEFPVTEAAAVAAREAGHPVVMGAPNVLRGGSHKRVKVMTAADMVARGLCTVLASDYYYPALVQAPFRLAAGGVAALPDAWALVSAAPAAAAGLADRGTLAPGRRADLVLVDDTDAALPRVAATLVAGQPVYLGDPALAWSAAAAPPVSAPA